MAAGKANAHLEDQSPSKEQPDIATVELLIQGKKVRTVIDTGASGCLISQTLLNQLNMIPQEASNVDIIGINGAKSRPIGIVRDVQISYQGTELARPTMQVMEANNYLAILGSDWLKAHKAAVDYGRKALILPDKLLTIPLTITKERKPIIYPETDEYEKQEIYEEEYYEAEMVQKAMDYTEKNIITPKQEIKGEWEELDDEQRTVPNTLTKEQQRELDQLLEKYKDLFAEDMTQLGKTRLETHHIPVTMDRPIQSRMFQYKDEVTKNFIKEECKKMLEAGVIEECQSPWAANVVVVKKKNGNSRLCIDYRKLNEITITDSFPMPRVDDIFDSMKGAKWFSSLDLASGYWQMEMKEEDKDKTAFRTHNGLYRFKRMPFGLKNAPASFQKMMNIVLRGYEGNFAHVYIDDINVYSKTFEEHMEHLEKVFERIKEAGLKMQRAKCSFIKAELEFLGHIVSREGIKVDPEKVEKVKNWPRPTTTKHIQQFMGLVGYYRRFLKDLSKIAGPLYKLTRKDKDTGKTQPFEWTETQEKAFNIIKEMLISAEVMVYPDFNKQFFITTDAAKVGLGAVLQQKDENGKLKPIAYASKSLVEAEGRYSATELELLAIVWAVRKWNPYIANTQFTVYTDHKPLAGLIKQQSPLESRINRLVSKLAGYNITIEHISGKSNCVADALSRRKEEFLKEIEPGGAD